MSMIELCIALVVAGILSGMAVAGTSFYIKETSDTNAKANLEIVATAQWRRVAATGSFTDNPTTLDVVAPPTVTTQPSNDPETVSMAVIDNTLRLAVKSSTGTCFARFYPDPLETTKMTETEVTGLCSALEVEEP